MITKGQARNIGARGLAIPEVGLRPESFAYLRAGGTPVPTLPVTVAFYPDGTRHIVDGRHRIAIARDANETWIKGRLVGYGKRLGVLWSFTGHFPI